jgi:hypothetical protein
LQERVDVLFQYAGRVNEDSSEILYTEVIIERTCLQKAMSNVETTRRGLGRILTVLSGNASVT